MEPVLDTSQMSKYDELQNVLKGRKEPFQIFVALFDLFLVLALMEDGTSLRLGVMGTGQGSGSMSLETRIKMKTNISFAACSQSQCFNHWFMDVGCCWYSCHLMVNVYFHTEGAIWNGSPWADLRGMKDTEGYYPIISWNQTRDLQATNETVFVDWRLIQLARCRPQSKVLGCPRKLLTVVNGL